LDTDTTTSCLITLISKYYAILSFFLFETRYKLKTSRRFLQTEKEEKTQRMTTNGSF